MVNFYVGWIAILAGLVAGAAIGMFFHIPVLSLVVATVTFLYQGLAL